MPVPMFDPGSIVAAKVADLETRYRAAYLEMKAKTAPLDYEGWPMVWDEATGRYRTSIMGPYGQRQVGTSPYLD